MKNTFLEPVIAQNKHVILVSNKVRLGGLKIKLIQYFFFLTFYRWSESTLQYQTFILQVCQIYAIWLSRFLMPVSGLFLTLLFCQLIPLFMLLSCDLLFISESMNLMSIIYSLFIIAEFVSILNSLRIIWFIRFFSKFLLNHNNN